MCILHHVHYSNGASVCAGPRALRPKLKPFLNVMSRFMKHIEDGRRRSLIFSQCIGLRFVNYMVYKAYIISRVIDTVAIVNERNCLHQPFGAVLTKFRTKWKRVPLLHFVSQIIHKCESKGPEDIQDVD